MKQSVNPVVAAIVVILLVAVAGFFIWRGSEGTGAAGPEATKMPKSAEDAFSKMGSGGTTNPNQNK